MSSPGRELQAINRKFCLGAKLLRWQTHDNRFTNVNPGEGRNRWDISVPWLRSLQFKRHNHYIFFIDIDGFRLDERILNASKDVQAELNNLMNTNYAIMKASGKSGAHIYLRLAFGLNWTEHHCMEKMLDIAYTVYENAGLAKKGFLIGPLKKDGLEHDCPGFIDTRVYAPERMIRGFSRHPVSKLFSVPYTDKDDLISVQARMRLLDPITNYVDFPPVVFGRPDLLHYEATTAYTNSDVPVDVQFLRSMVDKDFRGDPVYQRLPDTLKAIVRMKNDIKHDMKWPLLCHLAFYELMNPEEICKWVWKYCKWQDLTDWNKTFDHCVYSYNWVNNRKVFNTLMPYCEPMNVPLKREYYKKDEEI